MNTPHPNAEILRAIADGKKVRVYSPYSEKWHTLGMNSGAVLLYPPSCGYKFEVVPDPVMLYTVYEPLLSGGRVRVASYECLLTAQRVAATHPERKRTIVIFDERVE